MRLETAACRLLDDAEIARIVDYIYRILDEVGLRIENAAMCQHIRERGATWDGDFQVRFPKTLMERYVDSERLGPDEAPVAKTSLQCSGTVGGYPLRWVDPGDSKVKFHTARSCADVTRLADFLPRISAIGTVGIPSDVPPVLQPLFTRLVCWRYAEHKLANSHIIWDNALLPYVVDFCRVVSEMESEQGGMERWFRATNYLVSPLRYPAEEAAQFEWCWKNGVKMAIGNLASFGGTAPVTIAGGVGLALAETLALSFIHHVFYGDRGLYLATPIAPLDMRTGFMPYGRPEQVLAALAMRDICRYMGTHDDVRFNTPCAAKGSDIEAGLTKGFQAGLQMGVFGGVGWSFGKFSTDEVIDPRMMVIEDEFLGSMERLGRGVEVNDDTLPFDVVKEVGPGGEFLSHPHTLEHFRRELWSPRFASGENIESWTAAGSVTILEKARRQVLDVLDTHHPRGIKAETEEALFALVDRAARELGVEGYTRPELPE